MSGMTRGQWLLRLGASEFQWYFDAAHPARLATSLTLSRPNLCSRTCSVAVAKMHSLATSLRLPLVSQSAARRSFTPATLVVVCMEVADVGLK